MIEPILTQKVHSREDVNALLNAARRQGSSDVHLSTENRIRLRIDGSLHYASRRPLAPDEIDTVLFYTYGENKAARANLNAGGDLDFVYDSSAKQEASARWRVNAATCYEHNRRVLTIVMRAINSSPPALSDLGVEDEIIETCCDMEHGLVVVAGETGSGKSTLLSSLLAWRASLKSEKFLTYESPIEYVYTDIDTIEARGSDIRQYEVGPGGNYACFADGLRGALRQDPDVIVVGEARDRETIDAALYGAMTGHALFTTNHTGSVAKTIDRILTTFPAHERAVKQMDLIDSLQLIVHQSLVAKEGGGRIAIKEYLRFDGKVKDALRHCDSRAIFSECYKHVLSSGVSRVVDARQKFERGLISSDTLRRQEMILEADYQGGFNEY